MKELEEIKEYFGEQCKTFPELAEINNRLSEKTKQILYEIGLPNYKGYGGEYKCLDKLQLLNNQYVLFAQESFFENQKRYIDLETGNVININTFPDGSESKYIVNSDLESYINYLYIYKRYMQEVELPEKLGNYDENHSKYAKELKKQFLKVNNDVNDTSWWELIEEMHLGVI